MIKRWMASAMILPLLLAGCGTQAGGLGLAPVGQQAASVKAGGVAEVSADASPSIGGGIQGYAAASSSAFSVVTYNTAIGNSAIKTNQADFIKLPFYQRVITGAADAPILCLQEVGNAQHDALKKHAKNGNFNMYLQHVGLRFRQNNMLVVPKRFKVIRFDNTYYKFEHLKAAAGQVKDFLKDKIDRDADKPVNWGQVSEPRGYQVAQLLDTVTGKRFTLFNSHVSYYDPIRPAHIKLLMAAAHKAEKNGPVIVAGDLNTRTPECDPDGRDAHVRAFFAGYEDLGPKGKPPIKPNIDYVLAKGFVGQSSRWYLGDSIALPGSPDAMTVSDHYAEEDVLAFAN